MAVLADLQQVSARSADRTLFDGLSLTVSDGDRIGLVGINGTGKSTLLRLVAGIDRPWEGKVLRGSGTRVGFLDQHPVLPPGTVREAVGEGWEAEAALDRLGMGTELDTQTSVLSGGQAKRVALARVLARPAELLVLDEPTNHLDLAAVAWLEKWLIDFRGGLVLVTHDRALLDRVTTRMVELDRGHSYLHEGGYGSYLEARALREERAVTAEASRRNLARRELAWLRRGAQARSRKPQARVDAARRVIKARPEAAPRVGELEFGFGTPRLGNQVIECTGLGYRYQPDGPMVLSEVDLSIGPRERLGIVGANGSGKSTLLDLLAGRREPTTGRVEVGPTAVIGYYDQRGVEIDQQAQVRALVAGPHRSPGSLEDNALLERFWFTEGLPFARVGTLSGGERRRLQLLLALAARPNVLFLDEPTNDLDLDTLRMIEDFFEDWPGALVVVSHDRTFLGRTTDRLMSVEPGGTVAPVVGGVDAWVARAVSGTGSPSRSKPASVAPPAPAAGAMPGVRSPLGRQLREMEKEAARLHRRQEQLTEALAVAVGHAEMAQVGSELAATQASLDEVEEQWLALAEAAESAR